MNSAEQSDTRKRFIFNCGCLAGIISICVVCSGLGGAVLRPDVVGLEPTFASWGLTAYTYESLSERFASEPAADPTPTAEPTLRPSSTPLPTATFTPFPTFTATPTPTASPTVPPTDTPVARP